VNASQYECRCFKRYTIAGLLCATCNAVLVCLPDFGDQRTGCSDATSTSTEVQGPCPDPLLISGEAMSKHQHMLQVDVVHFTAM
jgi:hypothetical protein